MVRNKNTSHSTASQPLTATASISKHGHALASLHKVNDGMEEPASPTKISKRKLGSLSPCKAKIMLPVMNGLSETVNQTDKTVTEAYSKIKSFGSSGQLAQCSSSPHMVLNGFHKNEPSPKKTNFKGNLKAIEEKIKHPDQKSDQKLQNKREIEGYSSRMHANSAHNVYRKMFGQYKTGQEVLARWSDGLYYLGTICDVYDHGLQCEMKFEDDSKFWVYFKDLHHINLSEDSDAKDGKIVKEEDEDELSDVTCVLCRDGASDPPNEIVLCDKCGQGYHQECHLPHIDSTVLKDEEVPWQCRNCVFSACVRNGGAIKHGAGEMMKQMKCVFPYDINSLTWNKNHKINEEEKYCYCGGPGDWYLKMLQCARCDQWFHEACLQCLESPILYGDRYYLFVCAVCNNGNEYIKRLPMKWVDVIHLVLYNITIAKKVKYYDVDSMITFFNKHMESLRLGSMAKDVATRSHLRQKVNDTLQHYKTRFQSSTECKKTKVLWGLRNRSPPLPPSISLPAGLEINDDTFETLDLKHGSGALSDSPTPLKKNGPCQPGVPVSPRSNAQASVRSPVKDLVKSGLFNVASPVDSARDNLFERFESDGSMPPPPKKGRPGRRSKSEGLKRSLSNSSLNSSKASWPGPPSKRRKRKNSDVSTSFCSSGSTDDVKSLRDAMAQYFGAEDRVKCGERFRVLGKRIRFDNDGKERFEYLIEWEGYTARDLESMKKYLNGKNDDC
uniref:metal-response element-binding transcription factor 2-like n=1 Tax=Styela clava TaxID=7725 RepID=UPI00193ABD11|nr:metal-response element-binding transcription factor 2-like [Styela clava]